MEEFTKKVAPGKKKSQKYKTKFFKLSYVDTRIFKRPRNSSTQLGCAAVLAEWFVYGDCSAIRRNCRKWPENHPGLVQTM